jgi:hypothetical protein
MGLVTAVILSPLLVVGVTFGSPYLLGIAGLGALGPVAGGMFAVTQGPAVAAGSWMAAAQSFAMLTALPSP